MSVRPSVLPNGLRVVTVPLHDTKAVTVFVFAKVGSRYETKGINGVSHFVEHLMFKGTKRRPSTLAISKLLDGVGAQYNAMTSKDWTGYYVKISAQHAELALDIVSDILRNSTFPAAEIEKERGAILEEINMYEDNPAMSIDDLFEQVVFGSHHQLGWSILGPRQVIRKVNRATLMHYRQGHYHAQNMWVIVTGRLGPKIQAQIASYFGPVRRRSSVLRATPYRAAAGPAIVVRHKNVEQTQIGLGVRSFGYTDKRQPALGVLSNILGGSMSSRLFIQVRERRGLCYSIHSAVNPYEDTGSFMIEAGLDKSRLPEALTVMMAELKRLKTTPVSAVELKRAKENTRGRMDLSFEDSDALASWYGRQALFHKQIKTPEEALADVMKVTAKDIQAIARQLFTPKNMRLAIIGPVKDGKEFSKIIQQV